LARKKLS